MKSRFLILIDKCFNLGVQFFIIIFSSLILDVDVAVKITLLYSFFVLMQVIYSSSVLTPFYLNMLKHNKLCYQYLITLVFFLFLFTIFFIVAEFIFFTYSDVKLTIQEIILFNICVLLFFYLELLRRVFYSKSEYAIFSITSLIIFFVFSVVCFFGVIESFDDVFILWLALNATSSILITLYLRLLFIKRYIKNDEGKINSYAQLKGEFIKLHLSYGKASIFSSLLVWLSGAGVLIFFSGSLNSVELNQLRAVQSLTGIISMIVTLMEDYWIKNLIVKRMMERVLYLNKVCIEVVCISLFLIICIILFYLVSFNFSFIELNLYLIISFCVQQFFLNGAKPILLFFKSIRFFGKVKLFGFLQFLSFYITLILSHHLFFDNILISIVFSWVFGAFLVFVFFIHMQFLVIKSVNK
ncbi:MAG: hypothetical protein ACI9ES_000252 [Oceanospirillaceae bacterium]